MVRVLFFSVAREASGTDEVLVESGASLTVGAVWSRLEQLHPGLGRVADQCRIARNGEFADVNDPVCNGDELAVLPPVSGG